MATSEEILNDIRDTLGNLVSKYKGFSTNEASTKDELKEIDKELGDCLNLLISVDSALSALISNDFNLMLQKGNTLVLSIEDKISLITTTLNAFDESKISALNNFETSKQEVLTSFNEAIQVAFNTFNNDKQAFFDELENEKTLVLQNIQTVKGDNGLDGQNGLSAYEIALVNGFVGTELEYLESLKGDNGLDGQNGLSAYAIALENGFVGNELQFLESLKGTNGGNGLDGQNGLSAYEIALENGFVGNELEWLASLVGLNGENASLSDTGWISLSSYLANGWVNYGVGYEVYYRKIGDIVFLRGLVASGASAVIFSSLPAEIRPITVLRLQAVSTSGSAGNNVVLKQTGELSVVAYNTTYTSICLSYLVN